MEIHGQCGTQSLDTTTRSDGSYATTAYCWKGSLWATWARMSYLGFSPRDHSTSYLLRGAEGQLAYPGTFCGNLERLYGQNELYSDFNYPITTQYMHANFRMENSVPNGAGECRVFARQDEDEEETSAGVDGYVRAVTNGTPEALGGPGPVSWESGETEYAVDMQESICGDHQGLATQIEINDLRNSTLYVFRESDGRLIGTQWGLGFSDVLCDQDLVDPDNLPPGCQGTEPAGRAFGFAAAIFRTAGESRFGRYRLNFDIDLSYTEPRLDRYVQPLRPGDSIRVVLVNHATGYMGTARTTFGRSQTGTGVMDHRQGTRVQIVLRPPNLRVWADRAYQVEEGATAGEDREYMIGAEGSALTSDNALQIHTEWVDFDGSPLPAELPGFTGRLSRSLSTPTSDTSLLAPVGTADTDHRAQFDIRPGRHTEVINLPATADGLDRAHYYLHVAGISRLEGQREDESPTVRAPAEANFSENLVCHWWQGSHGDGQERCNGVDDDSDQEVDEGCEPPVYACFERYVPSTNDDPDADADAGGTDGGEPDPDAEQPPELDAGELLLRRRPWLYVPILVPQYDAEQTEAERQLAFTLGLPDPGPVYNWVYRPELHYSVVDLLDVDITRVTALTATGSRCSARTHRIRSSRPTTARFAETSASGATKRTPAWTATARTKSSTGSAAPTIPKATTGTTNSKSAALPAIMMKKKTSGSFCRRTWPS